MDADPGTELEPRDIRRPVWRHWSRNSRLLLLLLFAPLIGFVGVVTAEIVPDGRIAYHLLRAEHAGLLNATQTSTSPLGTTRDHWTECLVLSMGLGDPPGSSIFSSALVSPSYVACVRLQEQLQTLEETGELPLGTKYLRYWHGYTIVTRPAVGILGVPGARWVSYALLVTAVAGFAGSVKRHIDVVAAAFLVAPALLTTDIIVSSLSIAQAIGVSTAWFGGWLCFAMVRKGGGWKTAGLSAGLAGAVSAYLDLMTTLPGALALTTAGAALGSCVARKNLGLDQSLWRVSAAGVVGWTLGLGWMWGSKWIMAAIVVGYDEVVDTLRDQIAFRVSGEHPSASGGVFGGLTKNFEYWWARPLTPWLGVLVLVLGAFLARNWRASYGDVAAATAVILSSVVAWFLTLNNHTQIHAWLVYRSLPIAFGGLCAVIYAASKSATTSRSPPSDERTIAGASMSYREAAPLDTMQASRIAESAS